MLHKTLLCIKQIEVSEPPSNVPRKQQIELAKVIYKPILWVCFAYKTKLVLQQFSGEQQTCEEGPGEKYRKDKCDKYLTNTSNGRWVSPVGSRLCLTRQKKNLKKSYDMKHNTLL